MGNIQDGDVVLVVTGSVSMGTALLWVAADGSRPPSPPQASTLGQAVFSLVCCLIKSVVSSLGLCSFISSLLGRLCRLHLQCAPWDFVLLEGFSWAIFMVVSIDTSAVSDDMGLNYPFLGPLCRGQNVNPSLHTCDLGDSLNSFQYQIQTR